MDEVGKIVEALEKKASELEKFKDDPDNNKVKAELMATVAEDMLKAFADADPKDIEEVGKALGPFLSEFIPPGTNLSKNLGEALEMARKFMKHWIKNLYYALETSFECNALCKPGPFYWGQKIAVGPPKYGCLIGLSNGLKKDFAPPAVALILLFIVLCCAFFWNCCTCRLVAQRQKTKATPEKDNSDIGK